MPPPMIRIFLDSLGMGPAFPASPPRKGHLDARFREECELVDSGSASRHEKACRAAFQRDYTNTTWPTVEVSPLRSKLQNDWVSWGVVGHSEVTERSLGSHPEDLPRCTCPLRRECQGEPVFDHRPLVLAPSARLRQNPAGGRLPVSSRVAQTLPFMSAPLGRVL